MFNDQVPLSREEIRTSFFRGGGENPRGGGGERKQEDSSLEGAASGDQPFPREDPLNMHETIAYLMQLAEGNLFLFPSARLLFLFPPPSLFPRAPPAPVTKLFLSHARALPFPLSPGLFLSSGGGIVENLL